MPDFEDIRPYHDGEVRSVVEALLRERELPAAMAKYKHPAGFRLFPGLMTRYARGRLQKEAQHVRKVHDVQLIIKKYLDRLIEMTTSSLTQEGLEELDPERPYLFISNHRDITMDPALVNYMIYHHGLDTLQIAIGDNLLKRPFISDLVRLNKSFIVKRSVQGRDKLNASKQLSAYIRHCIDSGQNVWIAQREGRAKDGIDKTETALIKMLHMAGREASPRLSLRESINALNLVPVAISYEFDPCDGAKAQELHIMDAEGKYEKDEDTDIRHILTGMLGDKGAVHVSFGARISLEKNVRAEEVARLIDQQISANYRLSAMNYLAVEKLRPDFMDFSRLPELLGAEPETISEKRQLFAQRLEEIQPELRPYVVRMYANPVLRAARAG